MSTLLATLGREPDSRTRAAWAHIRELGGPDADWRPLAEGAIGVARRPWQRHPDLAGAQRVLESDGLIVIADATLYDRDGLRAALGARGIDVGGDDATLLLAAAWRAWGIELVDHIVGDYAFVILDPTARRLVAARDPMGNRPLFHARRGDAIGLASSSRALALWRGSTADLNVTCLGAQVAGTLLSMGTDSVYSGVAALRPGFVLEHEATTTRVRRFWTPPPAPDPDPIPIHDAVPAFRDLLTRVVDERMGSATASVWMSGGWDSTAVFGAGQAVLERDPASSRALHPVSIRYPEGDPGYEDPWVEATAARWCARVEWIDSETIPLAQELDERAAVADEPPAHMYERWNVALARGSRRVGAHIALDGCGGDNLFQVSDVVMADALRRGRLPTAARIARARSGAGWRYLVRHALIPWIPDRLLIALERATGRSVPRHHMELGRTSWVPETFVQLHGLRERDLAILHELPAASHAQGENMLFVTVPALAWGGSYMRRVLLREGVEVRSPLLDPRVIDFALRRPVGDRTAERETKMLLRAAVRGWVPDEVLAPRSERTGVTSAYSTRRLRRELPELLDRLLAAPLRLADLGIVDPTALRETIDLWRSGRADHLRSDLFTTLGVEFWLRARADG